MEKPLPQSNTSFSKIEHLQLDVGEFVTEVSTVHSEVFQDESLSLPDGSNLPQGEPHQWNYLVQRLVVAVGGQPAALLLAFGIVVTPMYVVGGGSVALVCSIAAGAYLLIQGTRIKVK